MVLEGLGVIGEQCVDQTKELHDALVLPQVFVALQQEHELGAIAAVDGQLARPLLGRDDVQRLCNFLDADNGLVDFVQAGNRQLQVVAGHELWRHRLQLQIRQLKK